MHLGKSRKKNTHDIQKDSLVVLHQAWLTNLAPLSDMAYLFSLSNHRHSYISIKVRHSSMLLSKETSKGLNRPNRSQ